ASMYPAPSARKYCRYFRGQSLRTTKYPPTKFPAAATSPRPAASAVRNVRSCPIASGTGFSLCKPSIPPWCSPQSQICSLSLLHCETSAFSASLRYLPLSFSFFIRCVETESHPLPALCTLSPPTAPALSLVPPPNCPPPANHSIAPLPPV